MGQETLVRSIPKWLAPIVQELELAQRPIISVDDIQRARPLLARSVVRQAITELVRRGWLRPLGIQGAYEFIPGAAAGAYPSGDPWLVLRAELARRPDLSIHIGANSAAWLRGYAQRSPSPHFVVTEPTVSIPRPLRAAYRVLQTRPAPATDRIDGLPVPSSTELFVEVAQLAPRLPLDAALGWLRRLLTDTAPDQVAQMLAHRGRATRARAGYIAECSGSEAHVAAIAALGLPSAGPFYTGPRATEGAYSARWQVYDSGRIADDP